MQTIQLRGGKWLAYDLGLTPGGSYAGFVGARMVPACGSGVSETIEQVIDVEMGSTQAEIEAGLEILGRALEDAAGCAAGADCAPASDCAAGAEPMAQGGPLVYLECQAAAGDPFWRSPVYAGWLEIVGAGVDQRANGSMGARLHLTRANWWEAVEETQLFSGLGIANHRDAGHSNCLFTSDNTLTDRDLSGQARLVVKLDSPVSGPAALFVAERTGSMPALDLFHEGEEGAARGGVTGTLTADAGSSGGSYYSLVWSGSAETRLWHVDIPAARLGQTGGKPFRPVLRLAGSLPGAASEKTWARWELASVDAGGAEWFLCETPGAYLEPGKELLFGPPLYLPPWIPKQSATGLRAVLKVSAAGTGAHELKLDYVDFAPLDGWRSYAPVLGSPGLEIEDEGTITPGMVGPAGGPLTHSAEGPGLWISPGKGNELHFYFSVQESGEVSASPNLMGTASLYYRPRKRVL